MLDRINFSEDRVANLEKIIAREKASKNDFKRLETEIVTLRLVNEDL